MADLPELPHHNAHALRRWLGERLPSAAAWYQRHCTGYFVPKNLNFWYVFGALALLVLVLLAAGGLWYWSAGDQSLNTTLHIVQRYMPAGSRFQAHGVRGTLRQGGHIDQLVYTQSGSQGPDSGALTLTLDNVDLQWDWTALRDRATRLRHLHAQRVTFADTRVADPHKAKEAFTSLVLPVGVDAPFVIDALDIVSKTGQTTTLAQLQGRYTYHRTTARHELDRKSVV